MSSAFFGNWLTYSLGNEDTSIEMRLLPEASDHVLAVAGSGGRIIPLLAQHPRRITCVDVSQPQLLLTEIRLAALRALTLEEYRAAFGFPVPAVSPSHIDALWCKVQLSDQARTFLRTARQNPRGLLYQGKFEIALGKLACVNRLLTGTAGRAVFETRTLDEQAEYLKQQFPWRRWQAVVRLLGNASVLDNLIYRGNFPKANIGVSPTRFYLEALNRLLRTRLARANYLLQMLFFGRVRYAECQVPEFNNAVFEAAKRAIHTVQIDFQLGSIISVARHLTPPCNYVSLSDVPSFLAESTSYLAHLKAGLVVGARIVARGHLHLVKPEAHGFRRLDELSRQAQRDDNTQMWHFDVYECSNNS